MIHLVRLDQKRIEPSTSENRLTGTVKYALGGHEFRRIKNLEEFFQKARDGELEKILFAISLPKNGYAPIWHELIAKLMDEENLLKGAKAVVICDGDGELFTKDLGRKLIFACNMAGCEFPGIPLVEATGNLYNFETRAKLSGKDRLSAYQDAARELVSRLDEDTEDDESSEKKLLVIHAGNKETSNTLALLEKVKANLSSNIQYKEISIRNGEVADCRGCSFEACKHFGEKGECFYGGLMVEQVYPAILDCDGLLLVCPNYNDSMGANMLAMINRLTALFYNNSFASKRLYALVVSGYSGGELIAQQIIGALNCNKGFKLPPHFAMLETANAPGSIHEVQGIELRAEEFGKSILI